MVTCEALLAGLDATVADLLPQQVTDRSRPDCGGFVSPRDGMPGGTMVSCVTALAQARSLFPELGVTETVEAYLAEGIDISADGENTERSTGVYNAVCNRSLRIAAAELGRPELLAPVRRNLDLSYHFR